MKAGGYPPAYLKEGIMKKIILFIICFSIISALLLLNAEDYNFEFFSIYYHTPSIVNESNANANQAVPDGIGSSYINPALTIDINGVNAIYSNLDKTYLTFSSNAFYGLGLSLNNMIFTLSHYSSLNKYDYYYFYPGEDYAYWDTATKMSGAYRFSRNFGLGLSMSYFTVFLNDAMQDMYVGMNLPKVLSFDIGIFNRINLIKNENVRDNFNMSLSVLNAKAFEFDPDEYFPTVLPKIINAGISNETCWLSENLLKNISLRVSAGGGIYINLPDYYYAALGGELTLLNLIVLRIGNKWMNAQALTGNRGSDIMSGLTYGLGISLDMSDWVESMPLKIQCDFGKTPTLVNIIGGTSDNSAGFSISASYSFSQI